MTQPSEYEIWRTAVLSVVAIGQTLFVLLYATFPWYRSFLGRTLFYKGFMIAVLLDLGLFARVYPTMFKWDLIFVFLYAMLAIGVWFQFFAFLRVRTQGIADERHEPHHSSGGRD